MCERNIKTNHKPQGRLRPPVLKFLDPPLSFLNTPYPHEHLDILALLNDKTSDFCGWVSLAATMYMYPSNSDISGRQQISECKIREGYVIFYEICMVKAVADPEISKPGGVVPARYKWIVLINAPQHIPYAFVVREENSYYKRCILTTIRVPGICVVMQ